MKKIGIIGVGNMGFPMLMGAANVFGRDQVSYCCSSVESSNKVREKTLLPYSQTAAELAGECRMIVLAVKPVVYGDVIDSIKSYVTEDTVIISVAPGIVISDLKERFGKNVKVVRIMPNTPAMVGEGMTGYCFSEDDFTSEEKADLQKFLDSFGKSELVPERLMEAVVVASGSSPAYVYMFIDALADSAVRYGIPRKKAIKMAAQTVLGAAKMVLETDEHPDRLKDNVCSPGGTTIEGVAALEEFGFRNAVLKAGEACYNKAVHPAK